MIVFPNYPPAPPTLTTFAGHDPALGREADARRLSDRLLASDSTTRALLEWCEERMIGGGPVRAVTTAEGTMAEGTAEGMMAADMPPELLDHLEARAGEAVRHRRIALARGGIGLADLDLWWLPGRLPAAFAGALDETDHPFGVVVAPLRPRRRVVFVGLAAGRHLVEHRAVVERAVVEGAGCLGPRPIAVVRERYRTSLGRPG